MNTIDNPIDNSDRLKAAALTGDIDLLYTVIQDDPSILEHIDLITFVETPLHTAASMGHLRFATEVMNLKPSFAWKLDLQGFSPIHLALQNNQKPMVYRFVDINKDLVRVKGREGLTPLHFASQNGEVDLLVCFLLLCPESIEYLTVRQETALHIAVKNEQFEALQVLVGWLKENCKRGAENLENNILNQRDEDGNTILHISALSSELQALQLLVSTGINLKEKNLENKTALDITSTPEMKSILLSVGAKHSIEVADAPTRAHRLRLMATTKTMSNKLVSEITRTRSDMTEEQRNIWLIVATLIATAMYQSVLSPPGGVYQISAGDNNLNITSSNSTISTPKNVGRSVLSGYLFSQFSICNLFSFLSSAITIIIMASSSTQSGIFVYTLMSSFLPCYLICMLQISPTDVNTVIFGTPLLLFLFGLSVCMMRSLWVRGRW
ncbi:putative ankyrin repeat-containing domain, PGG domain-containing protein [Medicago truncatula]|uniref:Ankyrin repeat protein n=1 Tax=Medicago truncatula TaxID=3880 RepID=G7LGS5_MEDTR|nr:ankyrin repeat-containing protein BDA1 [Medicago truncatula]AET02365.1 ankyrin repeat protein [Medicago truncatula]RHN40301.1 putative ankyrin repeat-containing domain, PGG domain-containing protein [Medicago truncatula]